MIDFQITGTSQFIARLDGMPPRVMAEVNVAIRSETQAVAETARRRAGELFKNPAKIQSAIRYFVDTQPNKVTGTVEATGLPYLRIQEYGGVTSPHDIFPVNGTVLAFPMPGAAQFRTGATSGDMIFTKHVHHPGSVLPERSFLRYALARRRAEIRAAIFGAVSRAATATTDSGTAA